MGPPAVSAGRAALFSVSALQALLAVSASCDHSPIGALLFAAMSSAYLFQALRKPT